MDKTISFLVGVLFGIAMMFAGSVAVVVLGMPPLAPVEPQAAKLVRDIHIRFTGTNIDKAQAGWVCREDK